MPTRPPPGPPVKRPFLRTHHHAIIIVIVVLVVVGVLVIAGSIAGYLLWSKGTAKKTRWYITGDDVLKSDSKDNSSITTISGKFSMNLTHDGTVNITRNSDKKIISTTTVASGETKAPYKLKFDNGGVVLSGSLKVHAWEISGKKTGEDDYRTEPPGKYKNSSGSIKTLAIYDSFKNLRSGELTDDDPPVAVESDDQLEGIVVGYNSAGGAIWASIREFGLAESATETYKETDEVRPYEHDINTGTYRTFADQIPKFTNLLKLVQLLHIPT